MAAVGESGAPAAPGVVDLYRAMLAGARSTVDAVRRRRIAIAIEVSLIVAYVLLRTFDAGRPALTLWVLVAIVIAIASPVSGLVVLAAIAPFSEPFSITRQLGAKPALVVALGIGVFVRVAGSFLVRAVERSRSSAAKPPATAEAPATARDRGRLLAGLALGSAFVVFAGTALGVVHSRLVFDADVADIAAETWLAGMGGGLIVLGTATWVGASGSVRAIAVAVAAAVVGGVVSLVDYFDAEAIRGQAVAWLVRPGRFEGRLTGIIPSPNGVAALIIVPTAILVAVAVLGRDIRLRIAAAIAVVPLGVALYVTYSRAALIGVFLIAVVVVWRIRRAVGVGLLVVGIGGGLLLLPTYLQARSDALGPASGAEVRPGELLVASDALRLTAWGAAGRMWLDAPLTGHGFMSYQLLHEAYGDPILRSPHNEWLRLFAEEGIVVGLAGLAFVAFTAAALAMGGGALGAGTLAGFLGLAVAATFNNPFLFVQVLAIAFTVVGIGLGRLLRPVGR